VEESFHSKDSKSGKNGKNGKNVKTGKNVKNGKTASGDTVLPITTAKYTTAHEVTVSTRDEAWRVCVFV